MLFKFYLILLVSAFFVYTEATSSGKVGSTSNTKSELKKTLSRLRSRVAETEESRWMVVPPVAAYYYSLHSTPTTSAQSSQILHAVEDNTPLPKAAKAIIAVVGVGVITGAIVGSVMLTKMLNKVFLSTGSDAA
ncbi:hypothetical protein P3T76_012238 [Phytophthora citrophthora]|uniref:RxLR effector protein n=1 Tax=Phytophthora citrophthora TaxID=4793 RepID=A0AAD9LE75_9STRA|nr:hypothetical protein P3T76_012238 [Phytophthora citrophthora]